MAMYEPGIISAVATTAPLRLMVYWLGLSCRLSLMCTGGTMKPLVRANCLRMDWMRLSSSPSWAASTNGIRP